MPQISRFFGIVIYMYAKDHLPPHFHAIYGDDEAMIDIKKKKVINGALSKRALKLVKEWIDLHEQELIDNFEEAQKPMPNFKPIEPLN